MTDLDCKADSGARRRRDLVDPDPFTVCMGIASAIGAAAGVFSAIHSARDGGTEAVSMGRAREAAALEWELYLRRLARRLLELEDFLVATQARRDIDVLNQEVSPFSTSLYFDPTELQKFIELMSNLYQITDAVNKSAIQLVMCLGDDVTRPYIQENALALGDRIEELSQTRSLGKALSRANEVVKGLLRTARYIRVGVIE